METCPRVPLRGSSVLAVRRSRSWDSPSGAGLLGMGTAVLVLCLGTAVTAASSVTTSAFGAHRGEVWPFACPFILADACVLMRGQTPARSPQCPWLCAVSPVVWEGELCHLHWKWGLRGAAHEVPLFWGDPAWRRGSVPQPRCCCRTRGSRSHLEHSHLTDSPCEASSVDTSFLSGHLWQLLHPELCGGGG